MEKYCDLNKPLLTSAENDVTYGRVSPPPSFSSINPSTTHYTPLLRNSINPGVESRETTSTNQEGGYESRPANEYKVYKRRWYILLLFSLVAMTQGAVWNR
jgi:hypothetical protein